MRPMAVKIRVSTTKTIGFSFLHLFIKFSEFSEFCKAQIARNVAGIFCYDKNSVFLGAIQTNLHFKGL